MAKVEPTKNYGAKAELTGGELRGGDELRPFPMPSRRERRSSIRTRSEKVIAGQGTIGLELVEQVPDLGTVVIPVGGGGLASGIAARAAVDAGRTCRIVGVQAGLDRRTIADGIAVKSVGERTRPDPRRGARRPRSASATTRCRRDRVAARALEARGSRARAPSAVAALLAGKAGGEGAGGGDSLGRQHRPDGADLGHAPRAGVGRPLARRPHAACKTARAS